MWLMRLSCHDAQAGQEQVLALHWEHPPQGGAVYRFELQTGGEKQTHAVASADFAPFCRDLSALEPNRWREDENLTRLDPPLGALPTLMGQHLLRAMGLVMLWALGQAAREGETPAGWLPRQKLKPLVVTGPLRQYRTVFFLDPDVVAEDQLPCLDELWRQGLLLELVVNPRPAPDERPRACYLTLPHNKVLVPKVLMAGGPGADRLNAFWDWVQGQRAQVDEVKVG